MVFNRQLLIRSVRDAMALNFFANVEPVPVDLPNGDVDLEFKVEEKQTGQVSAGAGYNSEDKVVGNVGMGIPNFRGNGQNLSFNIEFGSNRNSFSVSFTEPWLFGRPTLMGTELYSINRRWYDDYNEARQGGSLRLGKRLRWPDNYFRVYASYRLERTRYNDFDDDFDYDSRYKAVYIKDIDTSLTITTADSLVRTDLYDPYPGSILEYNEEWNTASRIALTISRDSRNLPEFATSGSYITYTFENTGGPLGGFWKYQKHELTAAKFIPIWGNLALAARVQFGAIRAPDGDDNVLVSDRFTPGGTAYDGIVRGYDDGDLTPDSLVTRGDTTYLYVGYGANDSIPVGTEPDSVFTNTSFQTRVRGNYMLVTNIELQFPLIPRQLYVLGFYDAGNSWLNHRDFIPRLYQGVGLGFRLMVPGIGTIGFDFAYPLDTFDPLGTATDTKRSWKPHFQVGTTFR
jgi:outer membrane protein insertion porin family